MGGFFIGENQFLTQLMNIYKVFLTENTRYKDKTLNQRKVNIIILILIKILPSL